MSKIRVLARQALRSATLVKYTDGLECFTGRQLAVEVVTGSAIKQFQGLIAHHQQVIQSLPEARRTSHPDASGEAQGSPADELLVVATRLGRQRKHPPPPPPDRAGPVVVGVVGARAGKHLSQPIHFNDPSLCDNAPLCTRCKAALTGSESSDDEGGGGCVFDKWGIGTLLQVGAPPGGRGGGRIVPAPPTKRTGGGYRLTPCMTVMT